MTKNEFAAKLNDYPMPGNARAHFLNLLEKLELDPPPQPALVPFKWPVPDGYKVVTKAGEPVTQVTMFDTGEYLPQPIFGIHDRKLKNWDIDGKYMGVQSKNDLCLLPPEPETMTLWLNIYHDMRPVVHLSESEANIGQLSGRIGPAIKITFPKPINIQP